MFEVFFPDSRPILAAVFGIRWHRVHANHRTAIRTDIVVAAQGTAAIVTIVSIAVVGEVHGNNGREVRWTVCSDLYTSKPAIRCPKHRNLPAAPRLRRKPFDRLNAILLFTRRVFVRVNPLAAACTATVQPRPDESVLCKVVMIT